MEQPETAIPNAPVDNAIYLSARLPLERTFAARPTLADTARAFLQQQLAEDFPELNIDVAKAQLLLPQWGQEQGRAVFLGYTTLTLVEVLIQQFLQVAPATWPPDSLLSLTPMLEAPVGVAVDLADLKACLQEWAPLLLEHYQQRLVDYWGEPMDDGFSPWLWMSNLFKSDVQQAAGLLDPLGQETVQAVLDFPLASVRQQQPGLETSQAYICLVDNADRGPVGTVMGLVLTRTFGEHERVLLYTPVAGLEVFGSLEALEDTWLGQPSDADLRLHNYETPNDIFDTLALQLLERQLRLIEAIEPSHYADSAALGQVLAEIGSVVSLLGGFGVGHQPAGGSIPPWLRQAEPGERQAVSRQLTALAQIAEHSGGQSYLRGIPSIGDYGANALKTELLKRYPGQVDLRIDDIEITLYHVVNTPFEAMDPPFPPVRYEPRTSGLVELALHSASGFPQVRASVRYGGGEAPPWLTYDFLREWAVAADIGAHYPALLQQRLLDDPAERTWRQQVFCDHMQVLLPLQALELKAKGQLTPAQYEAVVAVVRPDAAQRRVGGVEQVVRPLAFGLSGLSRRDEVRATFLVGPRDVRQGPWVLYQAGHGGAMRGFAALGQVLDALREEPMLAASVLAAMTPEGRVVYGNDGFRQPHLARLLESDWEVSIQAPQVELDTTPLAQDFCTSLYRDVAVKLVEQARQSALSSADDRWQRYENLAWTLFDLFLPLATGTPARLGLLTQLAASLKASTDPQIEQAQGIGMTVGVLLNLALLLSHEHPGGVLAEEVPAMPPRLSAAQLREGLPAVLARHPGGQGRLLYEYTQDQGVASPRQLLSLNTFRAPVGPRTGTRLEEDGLKGLYREGTQLFAQVDGYWFYVVSTPNGVVMADALNGHRRGPYLQADTAGRWTLASVPRLLGGVSQRQRLVKRLDSLELEGRKLLASVNGEMDEAQRLADAGHLSADVQDILTSKVTTLRSKATDLESLVPRLGDKVPVALIDGLRKGAARLETLAQDLVVSMALSRPPSIAALLRLGELHQIRSVRKKGERVDLSQGSVGDFLQEYEIRLPQGVCWYAHFHYRQRDANVQDYFAGHLKTAAQRGQGVEYQRAQQAQGRVVEPILRVPISNDVAQRLIFNPASEPR